MPTRILTVIGARPQFIKAAVVSSALVRHGRFEEILVHTGQHYDRNMSDIFFEEMGLPAPSYNLAVGGGTHAHNTGRAMEGIEALIQETSPDAVMVYGDTDSTLAGALCAAKAVIPLVHVEAGLRSFNVAMPEEVNRVVTDRISALLLAPSHQAISNLALEGVAGDKVRFTGDVMYDAVRIFGEIALTRSNIMSELGVEPRSYVLATIHRKENVDELERLVSIVRGLEASGTLVILPIHPRTKRRLHEAGNSLPNNVRAIDPIGYFDMLVLQRHAAVIATDSGGVQKEAFFHGVPGIILRDDTEWMELVQSGNNVLVGADSLKIAAAIKSPPQGSADSRVYGDGHAADLVAEAISEFAS